MEREVTKEFLKKKCQDQTLVCFEKGEPKYKFCGKTCPVGAILDEMCMYHPDLEGHKVENSEFYRIFNEEYGLSIRTKEDVDNFWKKICGLNLLELETLQYLHDSGSSSTSIILDLKKYLETL